MRPTWRPPQLHVHEVFVVVEKFGRLDSVQDGPGAVDPAGCQGNAGKSEAGVTFLTQAPLSFFRLRDVNTHLSHGGGTTAPPQLASSSAPTSTRTCIWIEPDSGGRERFQQVTSKCDVQRRAKEGGAGRVYEEAGEGNEARQEKFQ